MTLLETLQKSWNLNWDFDVLVKILLMVFSWFLDWSIQSWITLVLTKYFSPACIFFLSRSLRMQKVLFLGQKIYFLLKIWLLLLPKESTFLRRKPESGCFGHRRSHQHYQGVLNTVCTLCKLYTKAVFGDKYLHYLYFLSAGLWKVAKCKKVKRWKIFKMTTGKTEGKSKEKTCNFLWWIISE